MVHTNVEHLYLTESDRMILWSITNGNPDFFENYCEAHDDNESDEIRLKSKFFARVVYSGRVITQRLFEVFKECFGFRDPLVWPKLRVSPSIELEVVDYLIENEWYYCLENLPCELWIHRPPQLDRNGGDEGHVFHDYLLTAMKADVPPEEYFQYITPHMFESDLVVEVLTLSFWRENTNIELYKNLLERGFQFILPIFENRCGQRLHHTHLDDAYERAIMFRDNRKKLSVDEDVSWYHFKITRLRNYYALLTEHDERMTVFLSQS